MTGSAQGPESAQRPACFECGFFAGFLVTAALNPWDRALYLAVINKRNFLSRDNWREPYRGLTQTIVQRSISSGVYFPLEEACGRALGSPILGGQAAGVLLGLILNPLNIIKYQSWGGKEDERSFKATAWRLLHGAGPFVYFRGAVSTAARDATFGLCFAMRKHIEVGDSRASQFGIAVSCAACGTVLSSPFNYIRNMSYAESSQAELESARSKVEFWKRVLGGLWKGARSQGSCWGGLRFLQETMAMGWGTARVAVGMALTDQLYRGCCARAS